MTQTQAQIPEDIMQQAMQWLIRLNSPELTEQEQAAFMAWLEADAVHQVAYVKAEQLWQRGHVLDQVQETSQVSWFDSLVGFKQLTLACCLVLFMALIGFQYFSPGDTSIEQYETLVGEQKTIQLPDGTHLVLNTNSKVQYQMDRNIRELSLQKGEIYLSVKHNQAIPFDVLVNNGRIRVLGTKFGVRMSAGENVVTVLEGRVGLSAEMQSEKFVANTVLEKNQRLTITAAKQGLEPEKVNAGEAMAWRKKMLVYDGVKLSQVVTDLNRYFEQEIILSGSTLGERDVYATLHLSDFETVVSLIGGSLNLHWQLDEQTGNAVFKEK